MGLQRKIDDFQIQAGAVDNENTSNIEDPQLRAKMERIYAAIEDPTRRRGTDADLSLDFDLQIESGADSPWDLHFFRMLGLFLFFLFAVMAVAVRAESVATVSVPVAISAIGLVMSIYAHRRIVVRRRRPVVQTRKDSQVRAGAADT